MASGGAARALDQTVNVPHSAIDNPLEGPWHICQGPPRVLHNSSPSEGSEKGGGARKVLICSFNMVIGPGGGGGGCFSHCQAGHLKKKLVLQSGEVSFKHLKLKTNESKHQVHSAM